MRTALVVLYSCLFLSAPNASAATWDLSMGFVWGTFEYSEAEGYSDYSLNFDNPWLFKTYELNYETVHAATPTHFGLSNSDGSRLDLYFAAGLSDTGGRISLLPGSDYCVAGGSPCHSALFPDFLDASFVEMRPVSEIPLPAAAWLFLSAIGGLGILKARGRRARR